jgi:hypothetical protein
MNTPTRLVLIVCALALLLGLIVVAMDVDDFLPAPDVHQNTGPE